MSAVSSNFKFEKRADGPESVCLLGATGSIGTSSLQVLRCNPERYKLKTVCSGQNWQRMLEIIREFKPENAALCDVESAHLLADAVKAEGLKCEVGAGEEAVCAAAALDHDFVIAAIVGAAGLKPAIAALGSCRRMGLANKEALVMTGRLFFAKANEHGCPILPIDSEHSAIFQALPPACAEHLGVCDLKASGVHKILLTGSGGPFRERPLEELPFVKPSEALCHPVWSMGPKITIDSSTMMNKGLEFIEARWLFNAGADDIEILIHPQSVVHSMVSYIDGAVLAQLGRPDMKTPIARALAYPERVVSSVEPLDFTTMGTLSFLKPDFARYPCLKLAIQASIEGQGACVILNAVNEVAVEAYLNDRIGYLDIARLVEKMLCRGVPSGFNECSLDDILALDEASRVQAAEVLKQEF